MSTEDKTNHSKSNEDNNDAELDRLARQMLLDEAKRNKIRAETQGALGWRKPTHVTNRKFLRNTLISNAVHNIHKNEQEKQQQRSQSRSTTDRKQDDYTSSKRRSRHDDDDDHRDERLSKRTK